MSLSPNYESLSAVQKQAELWSRISAAPYSSSQLALNGPGFFEFFKAVDHLFVAGTFNNQGDEIAIGRTKLIHANGAAAKVRWVPNSGSGFSGLFDTGAVGIARLSIAAPSTSNFVPGLSLKLLINGQRSSNLVAIYSLDGQGSDDRFFANDFSTAIPVPRSMILKAGSILFKKALPLIKNAPVDERTIPLKDMASIKSDGSASEVLKAPYSLVFSPSREILNQFEYRPSGEDFRTGLSSIQEGAILYRVFAKATPSSTPFEVGSIVVESSFVASQYEDEKLFFQHPGDAARSL